MSPRPLLITDCDEVLLHMVSPFRAWLDEHHGIHFEFSARFEDALRHKDSGDPVERARIWPLLNAFFETAMDRQYPIPGAAEALARIARRADIVILTNIGEGLAAARAAQVHGCGLPYRVIGNFGGKGPAVARLLAEYRPLTALFIDDLETNHASVAEVAPQVWRLHMVGEPEMAGHIGTAREAHARIDDWPAAERWLFARIDEAERIAA